MEIIRDIASIVGMISGVLALWGLLTNKGRQLIAKIFEKQNATLLRSDSEQSEQIREILEILISVN